MHVTLMVDIIVTLFLLVKLKGTVTMFVYEHFFLK